ncbi:MAG: hypothetical protein HY951_17190 [Bacteroidia bacterium]|nr:hypothetical protein [Bacteroidia bacterium]
MIKKIAYYLTFLIIVIISFRIYSSVFYPGLNSDNAVTILMVHYFNLPDDIYFWGQDRMGSVIPLFAQIPNKLFHLSAIYSEAIVHYLILIIGFFSISSFFKNYFTKLMLALILFLPPAREVEVTQLTLSIQYMFLFLGIYFILKQNSSNIKSHLFFLFAMLSFIIAVWDSDLALVSVALFVFLYLYYFLKDFSLKTILNNKFIYYLLFCTLLGSCFIFYAKSNSANRTDYTLLSKPEEIIETFKIFAKSLNDIFLFKINETFTSIYSYLALFTVALFIWFSKNIRFKELLSKRLFIFLLIDVIVIFIVIMITKWTFMNGVPRRYFNCTYISLSVAILVLFENLELSKIKYYLVKYVLLVTVIIGSFGTLFTVKYIWFHPFKPYSEIISELDKLGEIGIIGDYWNSYICSINKPDVIKATPHDQACVRNYKLVDEVFKQEKIYLIKDLWFESYPDTIVQFGRTLIKQEEPFVLANATLCRYKLTNSK